MEDNMDMQNDTVEKEEGAMDEGMAAPAEGGSDEGAEGDMGAGDDAGTDDTAGSDDSAASAE